MWISQAFAQDAAKPSGGLFDQMGGILPLILIFVVSSARSTLADHYSVPSESMRPTIEIGDRILVNKLAFGLRIPFTSFYAVQFAHPERGDVVILESPADGRTLVKRVMGLPGDEIEVRNGRVGHWLIPRRVSRHDLGDAVPAGPRRHLYDGARHLERNQH